MTLRHCVMNRQGPHPHAALLITSLLSVTKQSAKGHQGHGQGRIRGGFLKTEAWTGLTGLGLAGWEPNHEQAVGPWDLMWERAASSHRASQLSHFNLSTQLKCRPWLRRPGRAWYCALLTRPQEPGMVLAGRQHWAVKACCTFMCF